MLAGEDVTALIATYRRPGLLRMTLDGLMASAVRPGKILVSEGSGDDTCRELVAALSATYPIELVPAPRLGTRPGNRNHLARYCQTPLALLLDDDVRIDPEFLGQALNVLNHDAADVVTGMFSTSNTEAWFTFRGYWRPRRAHEPQAASLATLLAPSVLLRSLPLDENLIYGYEEADFSLRLVPRRCVALLDFPTVDLSSGNTIGLSESEKANRAESARVFVNMKRNWGIRKTLVEFLAVEMAMNALHLRRPLPKAVVERQWRIALKKSILGAPWPWKES
jgi:glycosyltransferase involved in cell wall biosynthesis